MRLCSCSAYIVSFLFSDYCHFDRMGEILFCYNPCKINANGAMVRKERCRMTKCRVSFLSLCCEDSRFLCSKQQKEIIFHFFKQKKSKIVCFTKKRCTFASQLSIGLWCNGNTADSGPAFPGSNPGSPTEKEVLISESLFCFYSLQFLAFRYPFAAGISTEPEFSYTLYINR